MSITMRTMSINETQGIIDEAGIAALRTSVNENEFRKEKLVINESVAKNKFKDIVNGSINTGGLIKSYSIKEVNVYPPHHPNLKTLGIPSGERNQYYLESIVTIQYQNSSVGETFVKAGLKYYDYLLGNTSKRYENNAANDKSVVVRSVVRLVHR